MLITRRCVLEWLSLFDFVVYSARKGGGAGSFFARDNINRFIMWCERYIPKASIFSVDDLSGKPEADTAVLGWYVCFGSIAPLRGASAGVC